MKAPGRVPEKKYPVIGACGLDCGLCSRHHTDGPSRCPGCCGPDFENKHPACGFITCCVKRHNLEICAECDEAAGCPKMARLLDWAAHSDSMLSYRPVPENLALAREKGIAELARRAEEKKALLVYLIEHHNDGRSKALYCTACQLLPLPDLRQAIAAAEADITPETDIKDKAAAIRQAINNLAARRGTDLKLRK